MISTTRTRLLASTLLVSAAVLATPAFAQTDTAAAAEDTGAEVVVTGSRIARPNQQSNSPIVVATAEEVAETANVTLDTFLNTLPQVVPAGTTGSNNPGNQGQSNIDLRGLGANRNLVLVDGRRPMPSNNTMVVDINTIPAVLVDRIDVITGGAGATYGADAVAGVVNVILKNRFEGIKGTITYANTKNSDAREVNASLAMGGNFADNRGNAVIGFDYSDRQSLIKSQRAFAGFALSSTSFLPEGNYFSGGNVPTQAAMNAVFAGYGVAAGSVANNGQIGFNLDGTLFSVGTFRNPLDVKNFRYPIDSSVNQPYFPDVYTYNFDAVNLLVLPLERRSVMAKINYEVSKLFQPFGSFGYTRYKAVTALAPTPIPTVNFRNPGDPAKTAQQVGTNLVVNGQQVTQLLIIPTTNPFITPDLRTLLNSRTGDNPAIVGAGATEPFTIRQRTLGAGARTSTYTNEVTQYQFGSKGDLGSDWKYEAYFAAGRTYIVTDGAGAIDTQRLQDMLEAADGGNSRCAGGFNPFGRQPLSAACIAYLGVNTKSSIEFNQQIMNAFVTGPIAELPAGSLDIVLGVESRKFRYVRDPGALSGPISGPNTVVAEAGKNEFMDYFAEAAIPLVRDAAFAKSLELALGYRLSKWESLNRITNIKGAPSTDSTYKAELSWQPIDDVRLRGSYQRAVRAPNFGELFAGGGSAPQYFDPCSNTTQFRLGNRGATVAQAAALCAGTPGSGSVADFANYVQAPGGQLNITLAGNPNVRPEKANTITGGVLFSPSSFVLNGFRASIDYYNIKVKDAILTPDPNSVLAGCFNYSGVNSGFAASNANCQALVRSGTTLVGLTNPVAGSGGNFQVNNTGYLKTSGIDAQIAFQVNPFNGLKANFDLYVNYLIDWKQRDPLPGLPTIDYAGTIGYFGQGQSAGGGATFPRWKGYLNSTFTLDDGISLNLRTRYIHKMKNRAAVQYVGEDAAFTGVPTVWYFDGSIAFNVENMTLRVGATNLFNKQPPVYSPNYQSGTDPSTYDVIGRRFFVNATLGF